MERVRMKDWLSQACESQKTKASYACLFRFVDLKETMMNMNLFKRNNARKKWHDKAWMVNPNKTKITIVATSEPKRKQLRPWVSRELDT